MRRRIVFLFSLLAGVLCAASARADVVHVVYQTSAGGTAATITETTLDTGCDYTTVSAPTLDGFIFTHWSSSESDPLVVRDAWGRALDAARFTLYQDVTLTAHYVAATLDGDGDGIPDGYELYWYGNTTTAMDSDTDGDGYTFAEEIANGTNPLFPDAAALGGIGWADMTVECSVEIVAESGTLPAATRAQVRALLADELAAHAGVASVTVKGDADLGIAPQIDVLGTEATATYRTPTLEIIAFEPQTGRVRIRVTPGEGNAIRAPLATGCVHVYGTSDLGEKMRYISGTAFDLAPYLGDATRGEADLTVALGSHTFIRVKVETTIRQEGEQE